MRKSIQQELSAAYQGTTYLAKDPSGEHWPIRIGQHSPDLDAALVKRGVRSWAFLTACNPRSEQLTEAENARRMSELSTSLDAYGYQYWQGEGVGDDSEWPQEPSFMVLGIRREEATKLAECFGQYALVSGEIGAPAELVWTSIARLGVSPCSCE